MTFKASRGNRYIELLSTNSKYLMNKWKIHSNVKKEYDALMKTYIYNIDGKSPMTQMYLPKDKKQKLDLCFPLLALQLCFPIKGNLFFDIGITLCSNQRKRITLSSNQKSKQNSSLFTTVIPFTIDENSSKWLNVLVDIEEIISSKWKNQTLKEIDFLALSGVFRLKRVFVISRDLVSFIEVGVFMANYDQLPKEMSLPKNIVQQYLYISSLCNSSEESVEDRNPRNEDEYNSSSSRNSSCSTFHKEKTKSPEVITTLLERSQKSVPSFLTKPNSVENCATGELPFLNLSMLTFSDDADKTKKIDSHSLSDNSSTESNLNESNLNVSCLGNEHNPELWMPICSSEKNDSYVLKDKTV